MQSKLKKYRIVKLTLKDDSNRFVVQRKYFGLMQCWKSHDGTMYKTEKEAIDRIRYLIGYDSTSFLSEIKKTEVLRH